MINKTELFRKIGGILAELNDQYQYIAENPGSLNELELELLSANAEFLAEHIKILKKLSETKPEKATPPVNPALPANPVAPPAPVFQPKAAEENTTGLKDVLTAPELKEEVESLNPVYPEPFVRHHIEEAKAEPVPTAIEESSIKESQPAAWIKQPEDVKEPVVSEIVIPEKPEVIIPEKAETVIPEKPIDKIETKEATVTIQVPVPTLNDIISGQRTQESVAAKYNHQPVKDLKSIINLNDKLLFIKELFNGYSLAYSEAIEILNRFDSFESADSFLKSNYAEKNNWSSKESTVEKLYDILHRRFS